MPRSRIWAFVVVSALVPGFAGCECSTTMVVDPDGGPMDARGDAPGADVLASDTPSGDVPTVDAPSSDSCGDGTRTGVEVCDDGNTTGGDGCSADCASDESCGNGVTDVPAGEQCDDGDTANGGACRGDCLSDYSCGNAVTDLVTDGASADEICDDGNTDGGDGCAPDCASDETCGNGIVDSGTAEACDDGNTVDGDLCSADCSRSELCGNGTLDTGEDCDDGARVAGDGCSPDCFDEVCGNSRLDPTESCDDGDADDLDGCRADCSFTCDDAMDCDDAESCNGVEVCTTPSSTDSRCVTGAGLPSGTTCGATRICVGGVCTASVCGDGILDARTEACDDGNAMADDGCETDCSYTCVGDVDCADADPCTVEVCDETDPVRPICVPGGLFTCTPSDACHTAYCDSGRPVSNPCVQVLVDGDGDGHAPRMISCGTDCDDTRAGVNPGATETCNGLDDNCSGLTDEGNPGSGGTCTTTLPGICRMGTFVCAAGSLMCVRAVDPTTETCNNVDDDCDGTIDNGNPGGGMACSTGMMGACGPGTRRCVAGAYVCQANLVSMPEMCDGADNNCDGLIDNGNPGGGATCSTGMAGICGTGTMTCMTGTLSCVRNSGPVAETCNSIDDNCDGTPDNASSAQLCPPTSGVSATACGSGNCSITGCNANVYDFDASFGNGCECSDTLVNACGTATNLGNVSTGMTLTTTAANVPFLTSSAPADWYLVSFSSIGVGNPRISFAAGTPSSYRFDMMTGCGSAASCSASGCSNIGGATGLTSWGFVDNQSIPGVNQFSSRCTTWPSSIFIRVYSTSATCSPYRLTITR